MRLSREEVGRRLSVAASFFQANPKATAREFNDALASGALTGKTEKRMALKTVYTVRNAYRTPAAETAVVVEPVVAAESAVTTVD